MADDSEPSNIRKTLTLTHKQAGVGLTVGAAIMALQPLFSMFQTREGAKSQERILEAQLVSQQIQISSLSQSIQGVNANVTSSKDEVVTMLRRLSDSQKAAAAATETRQRAVDDRQDRNIETLVAKAIGFGGRKSSN